MDNSTFKIIKLAVESDLSVNELRELINKATKKTKELIDKQWEDEYRQKAGDAYVSLFDTLEDLMHVNPTKILERRFLEEYIYKGHIGLIDIVNRINSYSLAVPSSLADMICIIYNCSNYECVATYSANN